jgi:ribosomal protein S17
MLAPEPVSPSISKFSITGTENIKENGKAVTFYVMSFQLGEKSIVIKKRYSDCYKLYEKITKLSKDYKEMTNSLPVFPGKGLMVNLETRKSGLDKYLGAIALKATLLVSLFPTILTYFSKSRRYMIFLCHLK